MGLDNLKVNVEVGKKGMEKLIDVLVDTFSPASETLGLLGDAVRVARVEVAAIIARKAKALADEHGFKLKAPPLKFLVPFVEKASIEDLSDTTLIDMWARLLVSAGSEYDARQLRYSTMLAEMSGAQARILQGIACNYGGILGENVDADGLFYELAEMRLASTLRLIAKKDPDEILDSIMAEIARAGVCVVHVAFELRSDKSYYDWGKDEIYSDELSVDFEILRSMGLLESTATDFVKAKYADISVTIYNMTELGFEFWRACCGIPRLSELVPKEAQWRK